MNQNHYFLRHLVEELRRILVYARLKQCFSQDKDELILGFERQNGEDFWMRALFHPEFSTLQFPESFHRAGRNSIDLFSDILLYEVQEVYLFENERAFSINFLNGYRLLFKLYGNRGNVILFQEDSHIAQFQKKLKKDLEINPENLDRPINQSKQAFVEHGLKLTFPTFGKEIFQLMEANGFEALDRDSQWEVLQGILQELGEPYFYIYSNTSGVQLHLLKKDEPILFETSSAMEALNQLYYFYWVVGEFNKKKHDLIRKFEQFLLKSGIHLTNLKKQLEAKETGVSLEELGHIIMANTFAIPEGSTQIELDNFYTNQKIKIDLNPKLNPIQNAENYYRKSKNFLKEIEQLKMTIHQRELQKSRVEEALENCQLAHNNKGLRPFLNLAEEISHIHEKQIEEFPFKEFILEGWTIWVGKSAKNNDLLTFKYAKKNDLWLHARDVPGSHVIIRNPNNKGVPSFVKEAAASLAAYYSKRNTENFVPVIITPRKYVRKTKDLEIGQVLIDREEVLLVHPKEKI